MQEAKASAAEGRLRPLPGETVSVQSECQISKYVKIHYKQNAEVPLGVVSTPLV